MIKQRQLGPVNQFLMGRILDGQLIRAMACYYIDGILIDSGPVHVLNELPKAFSGLTVNTLINTHHHEDHIGNNQWFQQLGCGPALAHPLAIPFIEQTSGDKISLPSYRQKTWGNPPPSKAIVIEPFVYSDNYRFMVLETPGHSPDHISLLEPEQGWLFAGDLYFGEKVNEIHIDEEPNIMLKSLMKLLRYDFDILFCSSGKVVTEKPRQALVDKIAYWEEEREKICCLFKKGLPPEEIRDRLYGKESPRFERCNRELGKIHLVKSFLKEMNVGQFPVHGNTD